MQIAKCLTSKNQRIDLETETLVTHTLRGDGFDASEDGTGRGTPLVASHGSREQDVSDGAAHPVGGSGCAVYAVSTAHTKGNGKGVSEDVAYTLERAQGQTVAYAIQENVINRSDAAGARGKGWFREESPTLGGNGNTHAVAFTQNQAGDVLAGAVAPALGTNANATGRNTAKVMATGVRRLTPRECERLQGMPDDHTLVPYRGKPAADGPRYKAIGNGMAVPCVGWILRRIHNHFQGGIA